MRNKAFIGLLLALLGLSNCKETPPSETIIAQEEVKFQLLASTETGIDFNNEMEGKPYRSTMDYVNVFNGGGVAIGDVNNDGLDDIYFTGNFVSNRLYLNKGDFTFDDITENAGVDLKESWCTGAVFTDINNDGWQDIYVCLSYDDDPSHRENVLFINQKDGTFIDQAKEYGINDPNYAIQAGFFDYDQDGDNDLFIGNHPRKRLVSNKIHYEFWKKPVLEFSDKLYRNEGDGHFTDVTKESGILNYGWTLSFITNDFDDDGWEDIYVAVDHGEPDRLYINNHDGTFRQDIESHFPHIAFSAMGSDLSDIDGDGLLDLFTADMLSEDNFREKTQMAPMNPEGFISRKNQGYHEEFMRNMIQLNRGNGQYSEIGQLSGMSRTDWTWATLFMDMDNDGKEDMFIANGYYRDVLDKDVKKKDIRISDDLESQVAFTRTLNSTPIPNRAFINQGNLTFMELSKKLELDQLGFSSGAAYGDLDNDGDLDLIVSNIDHEALVYRNELNGSHYLEIEFDGYLNHDPIGTVVVLELSSGQKITKKYLRSRGYVSGMTNYLHFGIGKESTEIISLKAIWPNGKEQIVNNVPIDQKYKLVYNPRPEKSSNIYQPHLTMIDDDWAKDLKHQENNFDDYKIQVLLPHKMDNFGPTYAKGDVNGDGLEDLYVGGASGQAGQIFIQSDKKTLIKSSQPEIEKDALSEDYGSVFFDADGDGDLDLYVVSGGYEMPPNHQLYRDRLYFNDGGSFTKKSNNIPEFNISGGRVTAADIDNDGDIDLFVCGRQVPHQYPKPAPSMLLINDGKGSFELGNNEWLPELNELGMVSDALIEDMDGDGLKDLVLAGEWMPIKIYIQKDHKLVDQSDDWGLTNTTGWWNRLKVIDIDNDGDMDIVAGNLGKNYKYKSTQEKPFHIYANDFDQNNSFDIALGYYLNDDVLYPVRGRQCSSEQVPSIAKKYPSYKEFASASLVDIYQGGLEDAIHYEAKQFASIILKNMGDRFESVELPPLAQISPVFGIDFLDWNKDGIQDIIIGGNFYVAEVETGKCDAGQGLLLTGTKDGKFYPVSSIESGLYTNKDTRDVIILNSKTENPIIIFGNNNDRPDIFTLKR